MLRSRQIGEYRVSSLVEFYGPTHTPNAILPDFQLEVAEANRDWLAPNHWIPEINRLIITIQMWIVHAGSQVILIDAGAGNQKKRKTASQNMLNTVVPQWMEAAGATRDKVTHVVFTHLHNDHVGWSTVLDNGRWVPTFPNARYFMPKEDFDHFKDLNDRGVAFFDSPSFKDSVLPVYEAGLVEFLTNQKEIAGCLRVEPRPGHSPGHRNYRICSQGEEVLFSGDVMHSPIQIVSPTWNCAFDMIPEVACGTRAAFLADTARSGALIVPGHFGPPHCGYVRGQAGGYRFEPATW